MTLAALLFLGLASSAGVGSYTVRPGDTLATIADRVGSTVDALVKANAIANPNLIVTGSVLKVPTGSPPAPAPETTVTVRPGDTLAVLAARMGTTVDALASANAIRNPNVILVGQVLHAPGAKPAAPAAAPAPAPAPPRTYVVARGDTLTLVAAHLGVSADALATTNRISDRNLLFVGQILTVPGGAAPAAPAAPAPASGSTIVFDPIASVKYVAPGAPPTAVVKPGDTASKIASRAHVSLADLRAANPHRSLDALTPGTAVTLPGPPVLICPVAGPTSFVDTWGAPREGTTRHEGVDMFAARGTPVVANVGGTLEFRHGSVGGNAYYLHGDDGNTYYGAHLDAITANAGRVEAAQQIGVVGDTGDAKGTPTHLHFEVHPHGGNPVDPYFTVDRWC